MLPTDGRTEAKADKKAALARSLSSFIQTEVSRAEKIKRGKKVSRIHLNLDGIIAVGKGEFTWIGPPPPDSEGTTDRFLRQL